ncbi:hypothetical protein GGS24DRAFT_482658 [Hypoxylon argillaceum]|nr:hypothetical protein GGS24DRAFT_482658 [Hypoxylon argillaceum]
MQKWPPGCCLPETLYISLHKTFTSLPTLRSYSFGHLPLHHSSTAIAVDNLPFTVQEYSHLIKPDLIPHPIMAYDASPDLGSGNIPGLGSGNKFYTYDNHRPSIIQLLEDLESSEHSPPNDYASKACHINSARHSFVGGTFNNCLRENANSSHFIPIPQTLTNPQINIPQRLYPSPYAQNMARSPRGMNQGLGNYGLPNYFYDHNTIQAPFQVPAEAATHEQISRLTTCVSANYQGDPHLKANQSADIPDELNTSVWITNLPPNLNHKMLLDCVRNCGKVYAAVVNGPENNHTAAASKLVFFDVAGAQNLLRQAREGRFIVGGYIPRVIHNRIRSEAKPLSPSSRVLHIEGPSCIVNQPYLAALFRADGITWQDEIVIVLSQTETLTRLEWRFGSYRCQAESARHLIDRVKRNGESMWLEEHQLWQAVTVHFGVDPCAPQPGKHSFYTPELFKEVV